MPSKVFLSPTVATSAATYTVLAKQSGTTFIGTLGSATQTFTLPRIARNQAELYYTFTQNTAAGEILVNPADTTDVFRIKATEDAGASVVTVAGTGIKNTAATNIVGDHITIVSDPSTDSWFMIGQSGIWGSQ